MSDAPALKGPAPSDNKSSDKIPEETKKPIVPKPPTPDLEAPPAIKTSLPIPPPVPPKLPPASIEDMPQPAPAIVPMSQLPDVPPPAVEKPKKPSTTIDDRPPAPEMSPEDSTIVKDYYYDDPFETSLHGSLEVPPFPVGTPDFTVVGWKGIPDVTKGTPGYQAAQVWGTMASTLAYVMNLKSEPPYMKDWATTYNLVAIPRAGNQLNAYYDRSSLRFFWGQDPTTKKIIYTCDAVGIVAHELGHAILDSIRPDLWNTAVLEFFAFHEAFGDILAIASVLQHDVVIEKMLYETSAGPGQIPDLWQSNVVSRLAEQLGHAIYYSSNMIMGAKKYLRNAFNNFKYISPLTLKLGTSDAELTQEPHNFSRVFSGAWYECFCELFKADYLVHNPPGALVAVKEARDTMIRAVLDAMLIVPSQLQFFQAAATTMVDVLEKQGKKKEAEIVKNVFVRRNLYDESTLHGSTAKAQLVSTTKVDPSEPPHFMKASLGATLERPARMIKVELPKWVSAHKDEDIHATLTSSVTGFLNYVGAENLLGDEFDNNMFAVTATGELTRNYICSSFRAMPQVSLALDSIGHISH